ncbi:hypothetical protein GCM10010919_23280 [Alishewanella longhuensis]|uniref:ABC transporter substrate-binding protein n=1 Tax=Alishewanella longhuensis TaxID=1091037 RepID=A0ABQ3KZ42_9ALTE|nr:ABC transporter substrate-binding protein [Alishewanella longhuensis]GHG71660.1 hypothetical protein GCM10010919_23280 [Alishewanella longhuensis]
MKWFYLFLLGFLPFSNFAADTVVSEKLQFRQALNSPAAQYSQALITEAYSRLGIPADFIDVPFGRSLIESNRGVLDGEVARVLRVTQQFPNLLTVPYVLFDTEVYLYVNQRQCAKCTLENVQSLAFVRGSVIVEDLLKQLPASRKVISSGTIESTKNLFLNEKVDAVVFAAYQLQDKASFEISEHHIMSLPDYHLLHRSHQALLTPLAAILFQLEREGFTERLRLHYGVAAPRRQLRVGEQPFATY